MGAAAGTAAAETKGVNEDRPHEGIGQDRPIQRFDPSCRRPCRRRSRYPGHFEVRKVAGDKTIKWYDQKVFVSNLLRFEYVGLEEISGRVWSVYYGPVFPGWLDEDDYRIMDVRNQRRRC